MNKILISFFSVILPKIMKFLNNHAEEMLDDILNKFYKNFKEIVNDDTPKAPKLEDKPLNEQEIIQKVPKRAGRGKRTVNYWKIPKKTGYHKRKTRKSKGKDAGIHKQPRY